MGTGIPALPRRGLPTPLAQSSTMRILSIAAAFFSSLRRRMGAEDKPAFHVDPIYVDMRNLALRLGDAELPELEGKRIFAVIMESGFPEAAYTLVAAGDGSASLYFSDGGGLIGTGEHADVRSESLKVVAMAEGHLEHMNRVDLFPIVKPGNTTFYIPTADGIFAYTAKEDDLGEMRDTKLSALFHQCHALITEMRIADEAGQANQDGGGESATSTESR